MGILAALLADQCIPRENSPKRGSRTPSNAISLQLNDFHLAAADALDVFGPARQRRAHLLGERVPLIHADDAGETAALVIQNLFDDMQRDAKPREARGDAAANVVKRPTGKRLASPVLFTLRVAKVGLSPFAS